MVRFLGISSQVYERWGDDIPVQEVLGKLKKHQGIKVKVHRAKIEPK
ncbi:MAG: hypothetical protein QXM43_06420 [Desulfurococcaceae archaeon]